MTRLPLLLLAAGGAGILSAQRVGTPTGDLANVGVDELFNIQVTSVGRKAQELSKAPAAVFVLTAEEIRRSGATSIPEALQWVPGLTVLRPDGRSWVVSARGSARLYSDKILVMIDGRSLFTPLFSGVIWDAVDVPLQDIERIEIVRGPGAVMWGPNAVNGVINIITKRAQSTTGGSAVLAAGNELRGSTETRWGAAINDRLAYRVWGKLDYRTPAFGSPGYYFFDSFTYRAPSIRNLDFADGRLGFRVDGQPTDRDQWLVQGDLYQAGRHDPQAFPALQPDVDLVPAHTGYFGGYLQARWTRTTSVGSETVVQVSYNADRFDYPFIDADVNSLNVDFQKRWQTGERNEFYWGAGYQEYWDATKSRRFVGFSPPGVAWRSGDVVARDEFQLVKNRLTASLGVRLDYSSYDRLETQPSFRLLYAPDHRQSVWAAASRAVRAPNRFDQSILYDNGYVPADGIPLHTVIHGSNAARSEVEESLEAGYRFQSGQRWSVDVSLFYSNYARLRTVDNSTEPVVAVVNGTADVQIPMVGANSGAGVSRGGEVWGTIRVRSGWRLLPSYSYIKDSRWLPPSNDSTIYNWDRIPADMRHQATLRSQHDLGRKWQLDLMARARSRDHAYGLSSAILLDARLSWRPWRSGEFSFSVNDLTNRQVLETYSEGTVPAIPIRRTYLFRWSQRL